MDELERQMRLEFNKARTQYEGIAPSYRPKIPKQYESRKLEQLLTIANEKIISDQIISNINSYEDLCHCTHSIAVAIVICNGGKIRESQNTKTNTQNRERVPAWQMRLEGKIDELRKNIAVLTAFVNGSRSQRMKNKVAKIKKAYKVHTKHDPPITLKQY